MRKDDKWFVWADLIRVVAIFLVVQAHIPIVLPHIQDPLYWTLVIWTNIVRTCVPLFIMLSGSLLLDKKESYQLFFQKRCGKVLLPWIIWTIIYVTYISFAHPEQITPSLLIFSLSSFLSYFWFLPMIFSIYLITPVLRIVMRHARITDLFYILSLWVIVVSLLPFLLSSPLFPTYQPSILLLPFQYSGYFFLGYLLRNQRFSRKRVILFGMLFMFGVLPTFLGERFSNNFLAPATLISSVGLFYLLFIFAQRMTSSITPFFRSILMLLSKAAFGIYLCHGIVLDITKGNAILVFFISAICIIFLQAMISFLRKRVVRLLGRWTKRKSFSQ